MRFTSLLAGLGLALSIHAPARAEIFDMDGQFPAPFRDVSLARSIGIDRIGGRDGMALSLAIEQQLGRRGPDGRPHFDLIALSRGGPDADAIVSGMADASMWRVWRPKVHSVVFEASARVDWTSSVGA